MTGSYGSWKNPQTGLSTAIPVGDSGNFHIFQSKIGENGIAGKLIAKYDYRSSGFLHLMLFHLQMGMPVPNRDDWKEKLFRGDYEESSGHFIDLFKIERAKEEGRLVRLMAEGEKEKPKGLIQIPNLNDRDLKLCPTITKEGNFAYVNLDTKEKVILWDPSDVSKAFDVIRRHMFSGHGRGAGPDVGRIYSELPVEDYDLARKSSAQ